MKDQTDRYRLYIKQCVICSGITHYGFHAIKVYSKTNINIYRPVFSVDQQWNVYYLRWMCFARSYKSFCCRKTWCGRQDQPVVLSRLYTCCNSSSKRISQFLATRIRLPSSAILYMQKSLPSFDSIRFSVFLSFIFTALSCLVRALHQTDILRLYCLRIPAAGRY